MSKQNTQNKPLTKQCDRCGETIVWNNNMRKFESMEYPGWQHACKQPCNSDGCENPVYFSNQCPKNPATGRSRPLMFPIPQNGNWVVHVHSTSEDQAMILIPVTGQTPAETAPPVVKKEQTTLDVKNKDVEGGLLQAVNDLTLRLNKIEEYFDQTLVPDQKEMMQYFRAVKVPLDVIAGKIANASIKTAEDIYSHNAPQ